MSTALELADALMEQAAHHRMVAHECDMRPEDTINWQHYVNCGKAARELRRLAAVEAERDALRAERDKVTSVVYEFHYAMKDAGWHPGRTDDNLCDIIRDKGKELAALRAEVERLRSGEPYGWAYTTNLHATHTDTGFTRLRDMSELLQRNDRYIVTPLYAAPPRRDPLTPEQIAEAQDMLPKVGEREDCYCSVKGSTLRALMGAAGITLDKEST